MRTRSVFPLPTIPWRISSPCRGAKGSDAFGPAARQAGDTAWGIRQQPNRWRQIKCRTGNLGVEPTTSSRPTSTMLSWSLRWGVIEWADRSMYRRDGRCHGFQSVQDIYLIPRTGSADGDRVRDPPYGHGVGSDTAAQIVFSCNTIGSGLDWSMTSGFTDEESCRSAERAAKLPGIGNLIGVAFGTGYRRPSTFRVRKDLHVGLLGTVKGAIIRGTALAKVSCPPGKACHRASRR